MNISKIIISIFIFLGITGFLFLAWVVISVNGGSSGFFSNLKPDVTPEKADVRNSRDEAVTEINKTFGSVIDPAIYKEFATSRDDRCHRGEHNWKRSDDYSNRCVINITKYYGFDGEFTEAMLTLENKVIAAGWLIPAYMQKDINPLAKQMVLLEKKYAEDPANDVSKWNPFWEYRLNSLLLNVAFAEGKTTKLDSFKYHQSEMSGIGKTTYEKADLADVKSVLSEVTAKHKYMLQVSISKVYFSE